MGTGVGGGAEKTFCGFAGIVNIGVRRGPFFEGISTTSIELYIRLIVLSECETKEEKIRSEEGREKSKIRLTQERGPIDPDKGCQVGGEW